MIRITRRVDELAREGGDEMLYNKVSEGDATVIALAKQYGAPAKEVAAMINQDRYRKAYNRNKLVEQKRMREFFREHPELMSKGGE
jgi:hypothetical protein